MNILTIFEKNIPINLTYALVNFIVNFARPIVKFNFITSKYIISKIPENKMQIFFEILPTACAPLAWLRTAMNGVQ